MLGEEANFEERERKKSASPLRRITL